MRVIVCVRAGGGEVLFFRVVSRVRLACDPERGWFCCDVSAGSSLPSSGCSLLLIPLEIYYTHTHVQYGIV